MLITADCLVQAFDARESRTCGEDVDAMKQRTKRLSKEFADNYVDETLEAYDVDETPGR